LLLGGYLGARRGLRTEVARELVCQLSRLPDLIAQTLELEPEVKAIAEQWSEARHALYLGRGVNFPVALEGALKLKEISYIHAEAYPAGELKHGPLALVTAQMPVVTVAPNDTLLEKLKSNLQEVRARQGPILAIATEDDTQIDKVADEVIRVPATLEPLFPLLAIIPLQLLAYHIAVERGCDVDKPRNLAKSVTVE
jgi:glucosamine--fructose-6-phosphate aminotransferase (isomerizing)